MTLNYDNRIPFYIRVGWLTLTSVVIFILARFFFIGSEEDYILLKNDQLVNIMNRTIAAWTLGLVLGLPLVLIEKFVFKQRTSHLVRMGLLAVFLTLVSALLGSVLFFDN